MAPNRAALPHTRRDTARARSSCDTKRVKVRTQVGDRLFSQIDIDVGRSKKDVTDLWCDASVADSHLTQGFQGERVAHRMRQDRNLTHRRITGDRNKQLL